MDVYVEYFWRPRNRFESWLARVLFRGNPVPVSGVLRGGPDAHEYPDTFVTSAPFVSRDHKVAEIKGWANKTVTPKEVMVLALRAGAALRREGMSPEFERRIQDGKTTAHRSDVRLRARSRSS